MRKNPYGSHGRTRWQARRSRPRRGQAHDLQAPCPLNQRPISVKSAIHPSASSEEADKSVRAPLVPICAHRRHLRFPICEICGTFGFRAAVRTRWQSGQAGNSGSLPPPTGIARRGISNFRFQIRCSSPPCPLCPPCETLFDRPPDQPHQKAPALRRPTLPPSCSSCDSWFQSLAPAHLRNLRTFWVLELCPPHPSPAVWRRRLHVLPFSHPPFPGFCEIHLLQGTNLG